MPLVISGVGGFATIAKGQMTPQWAVGGLFVGTCNCVVIGCQQTRKATFSCRPSKMKGNEGVDDQTERKCLDLLSQDSMLAIEIGNIILQAALDSSSILEASHHLPLHMYCGTQRSAWKTTINTNKHYLLLRQLVEPLAISETHISSLMPRSIGR